MRVAQLDTGRTWRGGQAQVWHLLQGLARRGHASILLAPEAPLLERARAGGIESAPWRALGDLDLIARTRALRLLRAIRPDLLHAHDARAHAVAAWAGPRLGVPVVVTRRSLGDVRPSWWTRRKYARGVDRYLSVSRAVSAWLETAGVPAARIAWVPSGVDLARLERARGSDTRPVLRRLLGVSESTPVVGTVAALSREKGIETFVRAAAEVRRAHPDARWVWIGAGPLQDRLEHLARDAGVGDRVVPLGFREDATMLVLGFTLFVSCSEREGLGTSVVEAQAMGVPVIATPSGGVDELVEDHVTGRLVPPAALGEAVASALGDPRAAAGWAAAALERVQRYGVDAMVEGTLEAYRHVLRTQVPEAGGIDRLRTRSTGSGASKESPP